MSADESVPPEVNTSGGTGVARVDAAVGNLDELDDLPVSEQVERYEQLHADLQQTLNTLDED